MNFVELGLELQSKENEVKIGEELILRVRDYLPINEKASFIEYVAVNALDDNTGCFSPLRVELYFALAICHFYAGIEFEDVNPAEVYDLLETNEVVSSIMQAIPRDEINFLQELVEETIRDMARYNSSAAGVIQGMSSNASSLDTEINEILGKITNAEGLELLSEIKNVMGSPSQKPIVVKKG